MLRSFSTVPIRAALGRRHSSVYASLSVSSVVDATNSALWLAVVAYGGSIALQDKIGRGWVDSTIPLRIGPSLVTGAGRGLFATADLPARLTLGAYPGVLRSPVAYAQKIRECPAAASYCWLLDDNRGALDPTDAYGVLLEPLPRFAGVPLLGTVDTTLALVNEPGPGLDVKCAATAPNRLPPHAPFPHALRFARVWGSVLTEQRGNTLLFATGRDIASGEELFLDYGRTYDRSGYGRS